MLFFILVILRILREELSFLLFIFLINLYIYIYFCDVIVKDMILSCWGGNILGCGYRYGDGRKRMEREVFIYLCYDVYVKVMEFIVRVILVEVMV